MPAQCNTESTHASSRTAVKPLLLTLASLFILSSLGCAFGEFRPNDPFDREYTLDEAQHRYTTLVRFSDFERAQDFVHEEERAIFMDNMRGLEEARFTDFESDVPELDLEMAESTVRVTYTIYTPSMPFEVEVEEIQVWSRDGMSNDWRVSSTFEGLQNLVMN